MTDNNNNADAMEEGAFPSENELEANKKEALKHLLESTTDSTLGLKDIKEPEFESESISSFIKIGLVFLGMFLLLAVFFQTIFGDLH